MIRSLFEPVKRIATNRRSLVTVAHQHARFGSASISTRFPATCSPTLASPVRLLYPTGPIRRTLFISTAPTPNPSALKFSPGVKVGGSETHHFASARDALKSPLATDLFAIDGVTVVFFGPDFVSVTKEDSVDWTEIKAQIFDVLLLHFSNPDAVLLHDMSAGPSDTLVNEEDDEVVAMIKELLATRIRPGVQMDGGDVVYRGFSDGIVLLQLQGACSSCPSSSVTLHNSIQRMLMHWIPEVSGVMAVEDDDLAKINLDAFTKFEAKKAADREETK